LPRSTSMSETLTPLCGLNSASVRLGDASSPRAREKASKLSEVCGLEYYTVRIGEEELGDGEVLHRRPGLAVHSYGSVGVMARRMFSALGPFATMSDIALASASSMEPPTVTTMSCPLRPTDILARVDSGIRAKSGSSGTTTETES